MIEQLLLHGVGDYLIQNDWMALNKKKYTLKGEWACQIHCITYSIPFFLIGSWWAVLIIFITHYIIDRTNIIAYFLAWRNGVKKDRYIYAFGTYQMYLNWQQYDISNFGFGKERPFTITVWLYIITDNIFHLLCNYFALKYFS